MTASYTTHGVCDDAKCLYAVGDLCVCACLGDSHGAGYADQQAATGRVSVQDVQAAVDEARQVARLAGRVAAQRFAAKVAVKARAAAQPRVQGRFVKAA